MAAKDQMAQIQYLARLQILAEGAVVEMPTMGNQVVQAVVLLMVVALATLADRQRLVKATLAVTHQQALTVLVAVVVLVELAAMQPLLKVELAERELLQVLLVQV
tara:strand:+ start:260 stop:574 length:315 start_codon:yes stop_codon:yes gene_type:complete